MTDPGGRLSLQPLPGLTVWPGRLDGEAQARLLADVRRRIEQAPFYRPVTPGGREMSVRMTNFGPLGWVTDQADGYRYQPTHPATGAPWPDIPRILLELWREHADPGRPPDACLVNLYRGDARMGLHQDRDETDLTAPVLSVSLGDTGVFRFAPEKGGRSGSIRLSSGDVLVMAGPARLCRHGIDRVLAGSSRLLADGGRLNLTLRRAG
ncbi:alpha-ketoglutarate-dependent dioxygenase AlkB family protein [Brevundimonas balnearis]|uniref:Alpha-ketoglutarate-dependent dioxygenase AlkB n=1 Tax=Brevundimonas balnearis TaxID=1572858 RepID=A0ABV6R397_9CAUL